MGGLSGGAMLLRHLRQEFSQSVLFVMFETNTNEASEYLSQYFSLKIVLIALAYTAMAVLLWTRLRPVYIPKPWRYIVSLPCFMA